MISAGHKDHCKKITDGNLKYLCELADAKCGGLETRPQQAACQKALTTCAAAKSFPISLSMPGGGTRKVENHTQCFNASYAIGKLTPATGEDKYVSPPANAPSSKPQCEKPVRGEYIYNATAFHIPPDVKARIAILLNGHGYCQDTSRSLPKITSRTSPTSTELRREMILTLLALDGNGNEKAYPLRVALHPGTELDWDMFVEFIKQELRK